MKVHKKVMGLSVVERENTRCFSGKFFLVLCMLLAVISPESHTTNIVCNYPFLSIMLLASFIKAAGKVGPVNGKADPIAPRQILPGVSYSHKEC